MTGNEFFECGLDEDLPEVFSPDIREKYRTARRKIIYRTELLNGALKIASGELPKEAEDIVAFWSPMEANAFGDAAAKIFALNPTSFDNNTPLTLAIACQNLNDDKPVEHRLEWPNAEVLFDTRFVETADWEGLRHCGIGGSEAGAINGLNPHRSPLMQYHEKLGTKLHKKDEPKACFARGHLMEDRVVEAFCRVRGGVKVPEPRMLRSKKFPHNTANIDAVVRLKNGDLVILDAKTTAAANAASWGHGNAPAEYIAQLNHYCGVLADDRIKASALCCLFTVDYDVNGFLIDCQTNPDRFAIVDVPRDEATETERLVNAEVFWTYNIVGGVEPDDPVPADEAYELSKMLAGPENPAAPVNNLSDSEEATNLFDLLLNSQASKSEIKKRLDALEKKEKEIKAALIKLIGDARVSIVSNHEGYYGITYAANKVTPKVPADKIAVLKLISPEAYDAVVDTTPGERIMRTKFLGDTEEKAISAADSLRARYNAEPEKTAKKKQKSDAKADTAVVDNK